MQDDTLIEKISNGEQDAFLYMVETYSKLLWVVVGGVLGTVGTPQDMEECISDVYVYVWKNPKTYNPQKGSVKTFLAVIAKNKALDTYRKLSKGKIVELSDAISSSDDDLLDYIIEKEMHDKLYAAIETLAKPNKEIVIRRFFFDEKPRHIAEKTDIPIKEVENRLYQSKLKLRKILEGGEILCAQKT